jgi:protein SCO1/2
MKPGLVATVLAALVAAPVGSVSAQDPGPMGIVPTRDLAFEQRLGDELPADARFVDQDGREVELGDLFGERPVVLAFVYYECPMLCTLVLNGMVEALGRVPFEAGEDYDLVAIGIDHEETPALARAKREAYLDAFAAEGRDRPESGWTFLVGEEDQIRLVADAAGFTYAYDAEQDEYGHAAGILVVTPDRRISRVLYGIQYPPRDLRLALVEASEGGIGGLVEAVLLFCLHYDPTSGKYGVAIVNVLRALGTLTVALLAFFIVSWLRRERRHPGPPAQEVASRP